jgi:hypothetical protein
MKRKRPYAVVLALALFLGLTVAAMVGASSASADAVIDQAVNSLSSTTPVYNDPTAERALTSTQVSSLTRQAKNGGTPLFAVIVPESTRLAYGDQAGVLRALLAAGPPGTYAVVAGNTFIGGSNTVQGVGQLADAALAQHKSEGTYAVISGFFESVSEQVGSTGTGSSPGSGAAAGTGSTDSGSSGLGSFVPILALLALGGGGVALMARRASNNAKKRAAANLAEVKPAFEEDVTKLGEDVTAVDLDIDAPTTTDAMRQCYAAALNSYDTAKAALDSATNTLGLHAVATALEEGRYNLACVRAAQAGEPMPERRAPCFFNPQHGPSVQDETWTPPGGAPRDVPVCAECADRLARGVDVDAKTVSVGGQSTPYWNAGPQYAGYAGGYYGGFGSMLPGLLIGTMLGGSFGGGYGYGGGGYGGGGFSGGGFDANMGGGDSSGGGWSFGGGDFGGGGGDFGGGGDSGGGSF